MTNDELLYDAIKQDAKELVECCYDQWKKATKIAPVGFTWPGVDLRTDDGLAVDGVCVCDLPGTDTSSYLQIMSNMAIRTNAVALLYYYQDEVSVRAHFESFFGSARWEIPIKTFCGMRSLGTIEEHRTDGIILYKEKTGQA